MIEDIAHIVEEKADEVYERALHDYTKENPGVLISEEVKTVVKQRATSQLMFSLSNVKFPENADQKERVDGWFTDSFRDEVVDACRRCMAEEVEKHAASEGDGLSEIDRYLRKHGMSLH